MKRSIFFIALAFLLIAESISHAQRLTPAEAKQRIENATPKALPQTPVVYKKRSDTKDKNLNGRVQTVSRAIESNKNELLEMASEEEYNADGALVKEVSYDYFGRPWRVMVFGYIDGMHVSNDATIKYDYPVPPPAPPAAGGKPDGPTDDRYRYRYEYSYDKKGRLNEKRFYSNTGQMFVKDVYTHLARKIERKSFNAKDELTAETSETYDPAGNLIQSSHPARNGYGADLTTYKYEKFDAHGNWTRRVVSGKSGRWGGGQQDFQYVEVRTITYFK